MRRRPIAHAPIDLRNAAGGAKRRAVGRSQHLSGSAPPGFCAAARCLQPCSAVPFLSVKGTRRESRALDRVKTVREVLSVRLAQDGSTSQCATGFSLNLVQWFVWDHPDSDEER